MKTKLFRKIVETHGRASLIVETWRATSLLLLLLATAPAFAQTNGITISNFSAAPGKEDAPTTLTFNIEWKKLAPDVVWSDTVWVFVDYNNKGTMTRLPLNPNAATLTQHSATNCPSCGVDRVRSSADGVWVVGNARQPESQGAFSATVQLHSTGGFQTRPLQGACIYAINYPPRAQYTDDGNIKLNGTPPFYLSYSGGGAVTVTKDEAKSDYSLANTLASFTDASLAPGVTFCKTPDNPSLLASSTGYCSADAGVTLALADPEAGATYLLYKGDAQTATIAATGGAATFSGTHAAGSYSVRVKESAAFCPATVAGTLTIKENPLPNAPAISQPANICQNGGSLTFVASGYTGALTWTATGGGAVNGNTVTISGTAAGDKTVTARSAQTYTGAPTCYSATVTESATVYALPTLNISPSSAETKEGSSVTLAANASNGRDYAYMWSNNETSATIAVAAPAAGISTYSCTVTSAGSCSATANAEVMDFDAPVFASSSTYILCGYDSYTWSDAVRKTPADCIESSTMRSSETGPTYHVLDGAVYYSAPCVSAASASLCPSPWRVPATSDTEKLKGFCSCTKALMPRNGYFANSKLDTDNYEYRQSYNGSYSYSWGFRPWESSCCLGYGCGMADFCGLPVYCVR